MTIDLDRLEAAAKAATQGPWLERHEDVYSEVDAHVAFCLTVCSSADECCITKKQAQANAAFIAAVNPATVLELAAELRKARAELKRCFRERLWLAEYMSAYAGPDWRLSAYEYLAMAKKYAKAEEL